MERLIELGQLLDYYGAFLTQRQQSLVKQYADEDCSLSEIAEREGISRQAVRDAITRAETELAYMEEKLGLIHKNRQMRALMDEMRVISNDPLLMEKLNELGQLMEDDDGV